MKYSIKSWFLAKNFNQEEIDRILNGELVVWSQTEKAYQFKVKGNAKMIFWCPKSCVESELEILVKEEEHKELIEKSFDSFAALKDFAKKNGVKVTPHMKKSSILANMGKDICECALAKNIISVKEYSMFY
ncbi:MAG: hypothetical protein RR531_04625 [Longicatena sp.]